MNLNKWDCMFALLIIVSLGVVLLAHGYYKGACREQLKITSNCTLTISKVEGIEGITISVGP